MQEESTKSRSKRTFRSNQQQKTGWVVSQSKQKNSTMSQSMNSSTMRNMGKKPAPIQAPLVGSLGLDNNEMDFLIRLAELSSAEKIEHAQPVTQTPGWTFPSTSVHQNNKREQLSASSQMRTSGPPPGFPELDSNVPFTSGIFDSPEEFPGLNSRDSYEVPYWMWGGRCGDEQGYFPGLNKKQVASESNDDSESAIDNKRFPMNSRYFPAFTGAANKNTHDTAAEDLFLMSDFKTEYAVSNATKDTLGLRDLALKFCRDNKQDEDRSHAVSHSSKSVRMGRKRSEPVVEKFPGTFTMFAQAEAVDLRVPKPSCVEGAFADMRRRPLEASVKKFNDETLFFLFYSNPQDQVQVIAAAELYEREWRYHKLMQAWITRISYVPPVVRNAEFEKGSYSMWDVNAWKKVTKELLVYFEFIENRPKIHEFISNRH